MNPSLALRSASQVISEIGNVIGLAPFDSEDCVGSPFSQVISELSKSFPSVDVRCFPDGDDDAALKRFTSKNPSSRIAFLLSFADTSCLEKSHTGNIHYTLRLSPEHLLPDGYSAFLPTYRREPSSQAASFAKYFLPIQHYVNEMLLKLKMAGETGVPDRVAVRAFPHHAYSEDSKTKVGHRRELGCA